MTTLGLWAIAEADPGRAAIFIPNGPAVSYGELARRCDQYGRGLQALGLRPGDVVAGLLPNGTDALALFFAAAQPVRDRYDVSSLRCVIHSAAPCPPDVKRQMIGWWGPVVTEYYAASEGGGTAITAQEWLARPGSVGQAWLGTEVRVLDDEGNDVPAGQTGLVYLRMGTSTFDYHHDEEKTRASRARGMFTVGDIGYLDADGYLFLCDRKSDMIISGGVNIYPAEIEAALSGHPAVADVAVFGVPHEDWGEEIKAVVQPAAGAEPGPALTADLLAYLGDRVARFKLPRTVDYAAELPRDPNGKLYKRRLRDPYWAARDTAI